MQRRAGFGQRSTGSGVCLLAFCDTALQLINQLLLLGDQLIGDTLQILDDVQSTVLTQVIQSLSHGDLGEVSSGADVNTQVQPQVLELVEVELLQDLAHELLGHHLTGHGIDGRHTADHDGLLELHIHDHGTLTVVGSHEVQQDRADVLDPLVNTGSDIFQRHLSVGLEHHQSGSVLRVNVTHLSVGRAQAFLGVRHRHVDEVKNLSAHFRGLKIVSNLTDRLVGLQTTNANGLTDLIRPRGNQISVVDGLGKRHQLEVSHGCGEHGVNENLVRDQAGHQSTTVVLVLLLLPVTPSDWIAGQAGINVLVDDGVLGGLGNVNRGLDDLGNATLRHGVTFRIQNGLLLLTPAGGLVDGVTIIVVHVLVDDVAVLIQCIDFLTLLGVEQDVQGLAVAVIGHDLGLAADTGEVLIIGVGLELRLQQLLGRGVRGTGFVHTLVLLEPLRLPLQVVYGVTAHDQNVGLSLDATVVGVAEVNVDAVHQFHLDLASVRTKSAAVRQSIGVVPEVSAVVAGDRAIEQSVTQAVVELELFQQVRGLGVGDRSGIVVGVFHVAAVVVSQRFKA